MAKPPPRHPLDIFDLRPNGQVHLRPRQAQEEFDRWYDERYGFGVPPWMALIGLLMALGVVGMLAWQSSRAAGFYEKREAQRGR